MKKWRNLRNAESGRYNWPAVVLAVLLAVSLLWQGVFAMLGTTDANADAFARLEAFGADLGDGLEGQRVAAWAYAVQNPTGTGGVWGQFWANAQFGAVGAGEVPARLPDCAIPVAGQMFWYNGVAWRVLHRQEDAALIITEHVHGVGAVYNTDNVYTRLSQSALRGTLNIWAQDNLGSLRHRALTPNGVDNDVRSEPGDMSWSENEAVGHTTPGVATTVDTAVFILSFSELNHYFERSNDAYAAMDIGGTARWWWSRSPGCCAAGSVVVVRAVGSRTHSSATNTTVGFRPALWISV